MPWSSTTRSTPRPPNSFDKAMRWFQGPAEPVQLGDHELVAGSALSSSGRRASFPGAGALSMKICSQPADILRDKLRSIDGIKNEIYRAKLYLLF